MSFQRSIWILLIAAQTVLGACVNKQKINSDPTQVEVVTEEQAKKILSGDQVFCQGECPNFVASFFLYHSVEAEADGSIHRKVVQCSATLIGEDKILTNKHCIEGILAEGDVLSQRQDVSIEVKFPKTATAAFRSIKAKKVLKTSQDFHRRMAPDWAIIQLTNPLRDREPVRPVQGDVENGATVQLFPVYFDNTYVPVAAIIKPVKCRQSFDGIADIFATDSQSPLFRVVECDRDLVPGNSGTGVFLATSGGLLGVMASGGSEAQNAAGNPGQSVAINQIAGGTMAHCLPSFSSSADECFYSDDQDYTEISKQLSALNSVIRSRDLSAQDWDIFPGFQLQPNTEGANGSLILDFNPPWSDYLQYIEKSRDKNLKRRFLNSFGRALFPMLPSCVEQEFILASATSPLRLPLMNMEVWDLRPYEWKEEPVNGDSKRSNITYTQASGNSFVMPVNVSLKVKGKEFIAESSSELPLPIKKFSLTLPVCR